MKSLVAPLVTSSIVICSTALAFAAPKNPGGFTVTLNMNSVEQVRRELPAVANNPAIQTSGMSTAELTFEGAPLESIVAIARSLRGKSVAIRGVVSACTIEVINGVRSFGGPGSTCTNHTVSGGDVYSYVIRNLDGQDVCMEGEEGRYEAEVCK